MILLYLLSWSWWGQVTREESSMTCDTLWVDQVQHWNMTNFNQKPSLSNLTKVRSRINNSQAGLVVEPRSWLENWVVNVVYVCYYCYVTCGSCWLERDARAEKECRDQGKQHPGRLGHRSLFTWREVGHWHNLWHNTVCCIFWKKLVTHFHITLTCLQLHHNIRHFE